MIITCLKFGFSESVFDLPLYWVNNLPGVAQMVKESVCNVGDLSLIPGLGRPPEGGHGNPLQYSCPENSMERGAYNPWGLKESDRTEATKLSTQC